MNRRDFLKAAVAAAMAPGLLAGKSATGSPIDVPYQTLGRTREKVSIIGLGGGHLSRPTSDHESIQIVRAAIDNGVNFMDNSWDYSGGLSEIRMGKALRDGYREKVFLIVQDRRSQQNDSPEADQRISPPAADGFGRSSTIS